MYLINSPHIIANVSKKWLLWNVKTSDLNLYLTFDDGPIPEVTPLVLQILKKYNAKATFFMVGENVKRYPNIYQSVIDGGHIVGNHTFNHLKGFSTSDFAYYRNIIKADKWINSRLFRPPHGQIKPSQIKVVAKQYKIVMWSILSGDFDPNINPEKCTNNIINNAKNGSIIVFHDSLKAKDNMIPSLENTLKYFSRKGFKFKSLKSI